MKTETEVKTQLSHLQNLIKQISLQADTCLQVSTTNNRFSILSPESIYRKLFESIRQCYSEIRKLSLKFICFLLHSNYKNKIDFCKLMDISPSNGRIVLNSFPKSLLARTQIPELLKKLNQPIDVKEETFCLIYDLLTKKLVQIKKDSYSEFDFVDPIETLVLIDSSKYTKPMHQDQ